MRETFRAIVHDGRIQPLEEIDVPNGTQLLITVVSNGNDFWMRASQTDLDAVWDNQEDGIFGELLEG